VARVLPPESGALDLVAREVGIGARTLERWREDARARPARLEAMVTTAAMSEAGESAWCREHAVYPVELDKWRALHRRAGLARRGARQPAGHTARPQAHQGTRTRPAAQGPGACRDRNPAGAVQKKSR
jgi:transposase